MRTLLAVLLLAGMAWSQESRARVYWEVITQPDPIVFCGDWLSVVDAEAWTKLSNREWAESIFAWTQYDVLQDDLPVLTRRLAFLPLPEPELYLGTDAFLVCLPPDETRTIWTCSDPTRILLPDQQKPPKWHCLKFN
jgi:hypothetical protein